MDCTDPANPHWRARLDCGMLHASNTKGGMTMSQQPVQAADLRKRGKKKWFKHPMLILFTLPVVIYTFIFSYLPMFGIVIAFKQYRMDLGIFGSPWVGLDNFKFFFAMPDAWRLVRNTVGYNLVFIVCNTIFPIAIAMMLYEMKSRRAVKAYQSFMFLPYYLSWVSVAFIGYIFLSFDLGILNQAIRSMGGQAISFYTAPNLWVAIIPIVNLWKNLAVNVAIYYSALLGIDPAYREAAVLEGASRLQIARRINLPFLIPMVVILNILAVGGIFNSDFGLFYQFTMDNTMLYKTTDVVDTYIFRALSKLKNYGMSSAAGLLKSVLGFILVVSTNAIVRKVDNELALY